MTLKGAHDRRPVTNAAGEQTVVYVDADDSLASAVAFDHLDGLAVGRHQHHLVEGGVVIAGDQLVLADEPDRGRFGQLGDAQHPGGVEDGRTAGEYDAGGFEGLHEQLGHLIGEQVQDSWRWIRP